MWSLEGQDQDHQILKQTYITAVSLKSATEWLYTALWMIDLENKLYSGMATMIYGPSHASLHTSEKSNIGFAV